MKLNTKLTLVAASIMLAVGTSSLSLSASAQDVVTNEAENQQSHEGGKLDNPSTLESELDHQEPIEVIEVVGRQPTPISHDSQGVYVLDRKMIEDYRFGNGNLNDILAVIPGVQYSDQSQSVDQASNIKPSEVSLSGAQGYQSAYIVDGVGNNSRLSTGNASVDRNLLQDVSGHSQASFVNLDIIDEIEVYDSNIPAKYGRFAGGLVKVNTRKAGEEPSWSLSYRQTSDSFVTYNHFYAPDFDGSDSLVKPSYEKQDFSAKLALPLSKDGGLIAQIQGLRSKEVQSQLGQPKERSQTNYNGLIKYHHQVSNVDEIAITALYAPYLGNYFDEYAINSDFDIDGGASSLAFEWQHSAKWADVDTHVSWHQSQNSKTAPEYWLNWQNIAGKSWGSYVGSASSSEGGYGSIDKTQTAFSVKQDFLLNESQLFGVDSQLSFGGELNYRVTEFDRLTDAILYSGSVINASIDCSGYTIDCVETEFYKPIAQLEAELGRKLDFSQIDDLLLFQSNVKQAGQYFQTRQVSPKSNTEVKLAALSLYAEQALSWDQLQLNLGLRYDINDFMKQHNIAPRLRGQYDLFADGESVIVFGANRYYEADLSHHKLNESIQPTYNEIRRTADNRLLSWERSSVANGYRTLYQDTKTPFSDELSLAYRQALFGGTLELKWLKRANKEQISRVRGVNDLGEQTLYASNLGSSDYERYSISWMARFDNQHIELNLSHANNKTDKASFDGDVLTETDESRTYTYNFGYDQSELVFIEQEIPDEDNPGKMKFDRSLITLNDLELQRQDFNRPYIANLSWGGEWGAWKLSAFARYHSKQDAIYNTGRKESVKEATAICNGCEPNKSEYSVYIKREKPAYWLLSGSIKYEYEINSNHSLTLSFEGENLTNNRTYLIAPYSTGTELGRRFWLGVSYQH